MANTVNKVIEIAKAEIGYLEKKSNKDLDHKTKNAGSANYTKYGRDMHKLYPKVMDFPAAWCDAFVDWCFQVAYGVSNAKKLLAGNFDDYTVFSANLYKNKKAWYNTPKVGDQVFFTNASGGICHTGLVYKVDKSYVYTIEGNTSGASGVIANGGGVCKKKYALTYSRIAGYGRPKYDEEKVNETADEKVKETKKVIEKKKCPYKEPTKVLKRGSIGDSVRWLQWHLIKTGFMAVKNNKGKSNLDGEFGSITLTSVKAFQKKYPECGTNNKPDGEVGKKSRSKLKAFVK